jgi:hypothetical protein
MSRPDNDLDIHKLCSTRYCANQPFVLKVIITVIGFGYKNTKAINGDATLTLIAVMRRKLDQLEMVTLTGF